MRKIMGKIINLIQAKTACMKITNCDLPVKTPIFSSFILDYCINQRNTEMATFRHLKLGKFQ
jgi:hypothetical protein